MFDFNSFSNRSKNAKTKLGNDAKFITMCNDGRMLVQITPRSRIVESKSIKYAVSSSMPYTDKYYTNGKKYQGTDTEYDLVM